ncbi:DUF726 domain-containing protein [Pacificoceanicola onchidii]|uniref:DUF726 domain-containing protein n=1 Tax=Pacificoceanicola onchidii TaxID=2562685 RepID=UPI0010A6A54D|nr:DUF726 domain-containing protein [Pacificoceanicola onchidii]
MPLLQISARETGPALHGATAPLLPCLRRALAGDPGPITIMVHGYKYLPGHPIACPHRGILARKPLVTGKRVISWPRRLGLRGQHGEGLGISFGWRARGSIWAAWEAASEAGLQLAALLDMLSQLAPERPIHLIGHSMGARVVLTALNTAATGTLRTVILLAAAEFESTARRALNRLEPQTQVLNVTSRENDLFDFCLERLVPAPETGARMLGCGGLRHPRMATIALDDPSHLAALRRAGFPIAPPVRRVCHWSPYLRPGVFPLYRALRAGRMDVARLRAQLPCDTSPRWSRLRPPLWSGLMQNQAQSRTIGQI